MDIFTHTYSTLACKELDWLVSDSEVNYTTNLKNNREQLNQFGWLNTDNFFTYKFNDDGFRSNSLYTDQKSIMFLGCSYTVGIGISAQDRWSTIVAKNLNLYEMNLGIGGSSTDTAFRLAWYWIPKLTPNVVVCLPPGGQRYEFFNKEDRIDISSAHLDYVQKNHKAIADGYKEFVLSRQNIFFKQLKNLMAIDQLCSIHKSKFVIANMLNFTDIDLARDLLHPGIKSNQDFASSFLSEMDTDTEYQRHLYLHELWSHEPKSSWLNEF